MFFERRTYSIRPLSTPEELADQLTKYSHCLCNGFDLGGWLFLNDSTSEDGASEFAVLRTRAGEGDVYVFFDSITVSWMNREQILDYLKNLHTLDDPTHTWIRNVRVRTEHYKSHAPCRFCQ